MKMYVAYDRAGKILAAVNLSERLPKNGAPSYPKLILKEGDSEAEIELSDEHNHLTFLEVCQSHFVDTSSERPRLAAYKPTPLT
ncbi:MAG TPA: hypothetical protein VIT23_06775 [Terrimicrobiaceae bacterium]